MAFKAAILISLIVSSMLVIAPHVYAKITCEQATALLTPCIVYGVFGGVVPPACCYGVKKSIELANTTEDRRLKCQCVKDGAANIPGLNYTRVNELPAICGTTSPYIVSPKTDCSKIP
ncbi:non-specific lipid-transfer protein 1 [Jatropha curcas]|uniref:non-specific lipid-transfer protein 1 n=1 Tax=Jatropha curcas TaxID=180498 RepID=UPI0005FC2591|nr:non-specific lipid-transfer protein 1 [Jatropha curcas]